MFDTARYELLQKSALNRLDLSSHREGALIRYEQGYGAIHPWPELGDPTLKECLSELDKAEPHKLVLRAVDCTKLLNQEAFFKNQEGSSRSLSNHATLPRLLLSEVQAAVDAGFTAVKVKRGKDWMRLRRKTVAIMEAFPELQWRFDFNGALTSHRELAQFLGSVPSAKVDFIEDPFSDTVLAETWNGFPIAHDRVIPEELKLEQNYLIGKPALQSREELSRLCGERPEKVVFTSYMDHPLGQLFALSEASRFYEEHRILSPPLCGLATHHLYAETPYHALFTAYSPLIVMPEAEALLTLLEGELWNTNAI